MSIPAEYDPATPDHRISLGGAPAATSQLGGAAIVVIAGQSRRGSTSSPDTWSAVGGGDRSALKEKLDELLAEAAPK